MRNIGGRHNLPMVIVKPVVNGHDQDGETGPGGGTSVIEKGEGIMSAGIIVQMMTILDMQRKSAHPDVIAVQMRDLAVRGAPTTCIDKNVALLGSALPKSDIEALV